MRCLLLSLALICSVITYAHGNLSLLHNLNQAEQGDYLVIAQGKCTSFFLISDRKEGELTIEEVSIPSSLASAIVKDWRGWFEAGAPRNTSWITYQINLQDGRLYNHYSFTKNGWFYVPEADNFLQTLLQLNFHQTPLPKARFMQKTPAASFSANWPSDGSPLAEKTVIIYFDKDKVDFPSYFPYWLQVRGVKGPAQVRLIGGGKGIHTSYASFPNP